VAIDRATRWVDLEVLPNKSAATAAGFLKRLLKAAPMKVLTVLTDNGKEFTDRFCATGERKPTEGHAVDPVCAEARVEHRLIPPRRPQTHGMVERFNGRISEVLATHRYRSGEDLKSALERYVRLYNHELPQAALGHRAPIEALKEWQQKRPDLFRKEVYRLPRLDTYQQASNATAKRRHYWQLHIRKRS
jgi:transposase InsO family protein